MIKKLSEYKITKRDGDYINADNNTQIINTLVCKINELVDAVNELQKHEEQHLDLLTQLNEMRLHQNKKSAENVQDPVCFISTTYPSDNKTTVFLGQKGASVEFNQPLPAGFMITIKEN